MSAFYAAALLGVLVLPGAFFSWGLERHLPHYSMLFKDWLVRPAGATALWNAVAAWPLHWLYTSYWDDLSQQKPLPWPIYLTPIAYLVVPAAAGWTSGWSFKRAECRSMRFAKVFAPNRHPTSWDEIFGADTPGFVRCRLQSGRWVGGLYHQEQPIRSSASFGKVSERDLYISRAVHFDQDSGSPMIRNNQHALKGGGIHLRASEIELLEFIPLASMTNMEVSVDVEGS